MYRNTISTHDRFFHHLRIDYRLLDVVRGAGARTISNLMIDTLPNLFVAI